jgi:release factor glutamine methyltransferase
MPNVPTPERASWTILDLVRWTTGYFRDHGIDAPRSEAEVLLAHALGQRRIDLYLNYDQPLTDGERTRFKALIKRRINGEPVAYITGRREFWSLELIVNPAVLIPRPETECLVEAVLPFLQSDAAGGKRGLDLGTGSGAIVIALAHECPGHRYVGVDRSPAALATARLNARRHGVEHCLDWICASWMSAMMPGQGRFDLIVSNPPYIPSGDIAGLPPEIRCYEPHAALDGSDDGLACLERIIAAAPRFLSARGLLALEMGFDQGAAVAAMAEKTGQYTGFRVIKDYSGLDRVVMMQRNSI